MLFGNFEQDGQNVYFVCRIDVTPPLRVDQVNEFDCKM
jgi:hypothetical protein